MNVIESLKSRKAIRAFKPDPVDRETLTKIVAAASLSPSWGDSQPWEIFIAAGEPLERLRQASLDRFDQGITSQSDLPKPVSWPADLQQRMNENTAHRFAVIGIERNDEQAKLANSRRNYKFFDAPAVLYLCMDRQLTAWSVFDLGLMAQSIMLAAQEFNVDTMPAVTLVTFPDLVHKEIGIPDSLMVMMGIAIGYRDPDQMVNKPQALRRPVEEFLYFKGF